MAEIIESAGGTMEKTRRSLAQIQEMNNGKLDYIIITIENDLHLLADVLRVEISKYYYSLSRKLFKIIEINISVQ